ncbi:hypothetical protein CEXT_571541 [Caerostris extrusa]|uniref:Uncharacterized protein n=1 Tax=Caerostris extrusa TaxID=172846 RepID=A0AAV4WE04_CAEEX|nr:hypothetical protein CEXT_571541 [Caerostris extrusa]
MRGSKSEENFSCRFKDMLEMCTFKDECASNVPSSYTHRDLLHRKGRLEEVFLKEILLAVTVSPFTAFGKTTT